MLTLSPRERAIMEGLADGSLLTEVAAALGISYHTAKAHFNHARRTLGARTMPQATARYRELRLAEEGRAA